MQVLLFFPAALMSESSDWKIHCIWVTTAFGKVVKVWTKTQVQFWPDPHPTPPTPMSLEQRFSTDGSWNFFQIYGSRSPTPPISYESRSAFLNPNCSTTRIFDIKFPRPTIENFFSYTSRKKLSHDTFEIFHDPSVEKRWSRGL